MPMLTSRIAAAALGGTLAFSGAAFATSGLDAYVLTAGGNSAFGAIPSNPFSCSTFAPDGLARAFGPTLQISLPTDGAICGVASQGRAVSAFAGPVQAAAPLAAGWGKSPDIRTFSGNAIARAGYGDLGVAATAIYTGASDNGTVAGAQAGARQIESMNFAGAGTGIYRPTFTIDGSLFNVGRTDSEVAFSYSVGTGAPTMGFRLMNQRGVITMWANGAFQTALPGMSVTGSLTTGFTVAGQTTFSLDIPIVFGVDQDIGLSFWAASLPSSSVDLLTPSSGDVGFLNTVKLTGIQVFDSSGAELSDFTITSGSGTLYGAGGVIPVPEPGTAIMLGMGLLGLIWWRRICP